MTEPALTCDRCHAPITGGRWVLPLDGGGFVRVCDACVTPPDLAPRAVLIVIGALSGCIVGCIGGALLTALWRAGWL